MLRKGSSIALAFALVAAATPLEAKNDSLNAKGQFNWQGLEPTKEINWVPCYQNFTCTRLLVPLDYDDPSIGETAIPFLRYASPNKSAEDLLFNPGGPAGSGINQVRTEPLFKMALNFVGTSHNFVTFDPRGVNSSDISLSCFQNSPANGMLYDNAMSQPINMNSPESFAVRYARDKAYGQWCGKALNGTNAKYANSVAVARDMLHYIETAKKQAGGDPKSAKLRFFGISYGTVLGAAFASLYPDRVERMVLDGVSDAGEYFSGTWYTALDSADRAMRFFFQKCFEAGPELCAFYEDSPLKIELRYNKLLTNVEAHPIVFSEPTIMQVPWTLTVADLISSVLKLLYVPMNTFPLLGEMLKGAEERNGTWIAYQAGSPAINANITPNAYIDYDIAQPTIQIRCLDASGRFPMKNLTQYKEYIEAQKKVTSYFGALGDTDAIKCTDMGLLPPSNQQFIQNGGVPAANKTYHPILWTSAKIDPVTPLLHANRMAARFPGSVVLAQESMGHGASSWSSNCTSKNVQEYLVTGTLPPVNTTCAADGRPFFDPSPFFPTIV